VKKHLIVLLACSLALNNVSAVSVGALVKREPRRLKVKKGWVPSVRILDLGGMHIDSLKGLEDIPGIESVTRLYLDNNNIHTIESGDFTAAIKLRALGLSNNSLSRVEPNAFAGLKNLKVLNLSDNDIESIPQDGLNGMTGLRFLGISNNPMINPKGSLQAQIPTAFITTLPITKENIKKWGALVGTAVAALISTIAVVTVATKKSTPEREVWAQPVSKEDSELFNELYAALEKCNAEEFDLQEFKKLLGSVKDFDLLLKRKELVPYSLIDVVAGVNCSMEVVEALVHVNPNIVNLHGLNGFTLLHYAAFHYNKPLVTYLVEKGANANALDDNGRTPLFYVTDILDTENPIDPYVLQSSNQEIIMHLLKKGADISIQDKLGNTVFHHLAGLRNADENITIVNQLLPYATLELLKTKNNAKKTAWEVSSNKIADSIFMKAVEMGLLNSPKWSSRKSK
jgi:hypothetical protein